MKLLPDEKVLLESDTKELILTTHRVRLEAKKWGRTQLVSIMLNELCSCEIHCRNHIVLLVLAALAVLGGLSGQNFESFVNGIMIGAVFVFVYLLTRRQILSLASGGATINVKMAGVKEEITKQFIDRVETAKNDRYIDF